jgi:hypothetical protein
MLQYVATMPRQVYLHFVARFVALRCAEKRAFLYLIDVLRPASAQGALTSAP